MCRGQGVKQDTANVLQRKLGKTELRDRWEQTPSERRGAFYRGYWLLPPPLRPRLRLSAFAGAAASAVVTGHPNHPMAWPEWMIVSFSKNKLRAGCYEHLDDHLALANQASLAMKTRHQA